MSIIKFSETDIIIGNKTYNLGLIKKIISKCSNPEIKNIVIDGFCGLGGVTSGFSMLEGWEVIVCLNHWDTAIETHEKNHPECLHLLEDFKIADLTIIIYLLNEIKRNNPNVTVHVWLSLECTNFSNAKGGQSRNADSRTLADHADRYVIELNPDVIWIENVKEFKLWGPMIPKVIAGTGKNKQTIQFNPLLDDADITFRDYIDKGLAPYCPLLTDKKTGIKSEWLIPEKEFMGVDFNRWKNHISSFGYDCEHKLLNCADFGVPQHRVRLIMQFNRKGIPAVFPNPTHDKNGKNSLPKWKAVKPCLDLNEEGESVLAFVSKKGVQVPRIKSPKTIERLINGINKHVLIGENTWIVKPNSAKNNTDVSAGASLQDTSPTLTCFNGLNIAKVHLVDHYFGNGYTKPITEPMGTTGTKDGAALHTVQFLGTYHSTGDGSGLDDTAKAIMTKDKYPLVSTKRFLMDTQFNNGSVSLDAPSRVITANRKHFYLVNFQWFNQGFMSIDKPSNTIIARQDKSPNYLITLETGELAIEVFENDPPHYVRLKKFMAENGIVEINMRMLKETEMLKIMTIPEKYKLSKSSTKNKKMIGNAVPSELVAKLGAAYDKRRNEDIKVA